MSSVKASNSSVADQITRNLSAKGEDEKTAVSIGGKLQKAEDRLLELLGSDKPDTGKIQEAQQLLDRAKRVWEAFQKLIDGKDQRIRQGIQLLSDR